MGRKQVRQSSVDIYWAAQRPFLLRSRRKGGDIGELCSLGPPAVPHVLDRGCQDTTAVTGVTQLSSGMQSLTFLALTDPTGILILWQRMI